MVKPVVELPTLEGAYLVLSGPGTGKTALLVERARQFLSSTAGSRQRLLALTFTNKAANEMRTRLAAAGSMFEERIFVGTFHSFGGSVLRSHGHSIGLPNDFIIYDDRDQAALLAQLQSMGEISEGIDTDSLVLAFARLKSRGYVDGDTRQDVRVSERLRAVYKTYQQALRAAGAMDFGDLVVECCRLFRERPQIRRTYQVAYGHVVVDEFQDTTPAQYDLLRQVINAESPSVFAVADEDQLIFEWNEARLETINKFAEDLGARTIFYTLSHRCPANIVEAANAVIRKNRMRVREKPEIYATRPAEHPICLFEAADEQQEAAFVADTISRLRSEGVMPGAIAVIGRARRVLDAIEESLTAAAIPAARPSIAGLGSSEEGECVLRVLRWIQNPRDEQSARRVIRFMRPELLDAFENAVRAVRERGSDIAILLSNSEAPGLRELGEQVGQWRLLAGDTQRLLATLREGLTRLIQDDEDLRADLLRIVDELEALRPTISARIRLSLPEFLLGLPQTTGPTVSSGRGGRVALLTYHQAKGLEFDTVFLVALEEGIFPDFRSRNDQRRVEEERRLFYVGITRVKSRLYLTYARTRQTTRGTPWAREPSSFLGEIPQELIETRHS